MKYFSCEGIESRRITTNVSGFFATKCCTGRKCANRIPLSADGVTVVKNYLKMCNDVIAERKALHLGETKRVVYNHRCTNCHEYEMRDWEGDTNRWHVGEFSFNLDGPCNSNCTYCFSREKYDKQEHDHLLKLIDEYCQHGGVVDFWSILSGEITIHPFRDRIYEMTKDKRAVYFTNCFIYDEKIGEILRSNPNAQINFSIDCGTPETWHKIKGHDNFHQVIGNLKRYREMMTNPFQLRLKYMMIPGVNDNTQDYHGMIDFVDCGRAIITRVDHLYKSDVEHDKRTLYGTARLLDILRDHNINVEIDGCFYDENDMEYLDITSVKKGVVVT